MSSPFWRTGLVDISDAELMVLDVLADYGTLGVGQLANEGFDLRFNRGLHWLDDPALWRLLRRWCRSEWIRPIVADDGARFELTPLGGLQWERERQPDWSRLVCARSGYLPGRNDRTIDTYFGTTASVVDAWFQTWIKIEESSVFRVRRATVQRQRWIYLWKALGTISVVVAIVTDESESRHGRDWQLYERNRYWWRDSVELMALKTRSL